LTNKEETNREEHEGRRKKEELFTRQLVIDTLLVHLF